MARRSKKQTNDPLDIITLAAQSPPLNYDKYLENSCFEEKNKACIGPFFNIIFDLLTRQIIYVNPNIKYVLGYTQEEVLADSHINFFFNKFHPDSIATQKALYKTIADFLKSIPIKTRPKFILTYNIEIKHKKGHYIQLLTHNKCIKYINDTPRLIQIFCLDISDYSSSNTQLLCVSKITTNGLKQVFKKYFYSEYERGILSKKEVEIWNYIQKGLTAKQIANKYSISVHTVNTHRKNIYKKLKQVGLK